MEKESSKMKYKIISIKDSNTKVEKTDSKSIERKNRDYNGFILFNDRALMFFSPTEYVMTSKVLSDTGFKEKQVAIILTTVNSIYILKVEEY